MKFEFENIGTFYSNAIKPYQAPRQSNLEESSGKIELIDGKSFEQALHDLEGFDRIWIIYCFHLNTNHYRNKVNPPRNPDGNKKGVFSTRAPYRPNPIGLSCVKLHKIKGKTIWLQDCDLLNETPILDIKPYIPYADSFPESQAGWLENIEEHEHEVHIPSHLEEALDWLAQKGVDIKTFAIRHLSWQPLNRRHKRIREHGENHTLAMQTWRVLFSLEGKNIQILNVGSRYNESDLLSTEDPYNDKDTHRAFLKNFPEALKNID